MNQPDPNIEYATRRLAGTSALRRIRNLVDSDLSEERQKALWAKRISVLAIIGTILVIGWTLKSFLR